MHETTTSDVSEGRALATQHERAPRAVAPQRTMVMPAMTFREMLDMGNDLVRTGFLPKHVRDGAQAAAIILAGRELGMAPMRAFRSLQMVEGKIVESADSQLGRFKAAGGRAVFKELSTTRAELHLRHPNGDEHVEIFTMEDAERASLTRPSRNGEPSNYVKHPKPMLRSRCITAGLKSLGWDGAVDIYDADEMMAEGYTVEGYENPYADTLAPLPPAPEARLPKALAYQRPASHEVIADVPPEREVARAPEYENEPASDKQRAFIKNLVSSHLFTEQEREAALSITTKRRMTRAIEQAQKVLAERREAEKQAKADSAARVAQGTTAVLDEAQQGELIDEVARAERDAMREGL